MELKNKVAESGIITLDLEDFFPREEIVELDIKQFLFREMILKEKEFRDLLKQYEWNVYQGKIVSLYCSVDAILPQWAFMLITSYLLPYTQRIYFGSKSEVEYYLLSESIKNIDSIKYKGERVVIKGCGNKAADSRAYIEISKKLLPEVQSLMFGEPCSTVPVYKQKSKP